MSPAPRPLPVASAHVHTATRLETDEDVLNAVRRFWSARGDTGSWLQWAIRQAQPTTFPSKQATRRRKPGVAKGMHRRFRR